MDGQTIGYKERKIDIASVLTFLMFSLPFFPQCMFRYFKYIINVPFI